MTVSRQKSEDRTAVVGLEGDAVRRTNKAKLMVARSQLRHLGHEEESTTQSTR